jgi:hypothetical protein
MSIMAILRTSVTEENLFLNLISIGTPAGPHYCSVLSHSRENGVIIFQQQDCEFKVGVAGYNLLVSASYQPVVENWLKEWGFDFEIETREVSSPEGARNLLRQMRGNDPERKTAKERVQQAIARTQSKLVREIMIF